MVRQQVMVEGSTLSAPYTRVSMIAFGIYGVIQAFTENRPLQRKVLYIVESTCFIYGPAHGAMIENYIVVIAFEGIGSIIYHSFCIAQPESYVADNDIAGLHGNRILCNAYTITRRCLSCY